MAWECSSCKTTNPTNALKCGKCGGRTPAPKRMSRTWLIGGAVIFFGVYMISTFMGSVFVAFAAVPTGPEIYAMAKTMKMEGDKLETLANEDRKKAEVAATEKNLKAQSFVVHAILMWFAALLLFPLGGALVGYISEGRTILEAGFGALAGQLLGFAYMKVAQHADIGLVELAIGLGVGFGIACIGAYVGEAVQEKREREALMRAELDEMTFSK